MERIIRKFQFTVDTYFNDDYVSLRMEAKVNGELVSVNQVAPQQDDLASTFDHMTRQIRSAIKDIDKINDMYERHTYKIKHF